jgi:DNA primase
VVVEGRADVLNLLKNDVASVIAVGGATEVPKSIINLCREKEVTVFLDGDRGGDMILRNLTSACDVDFVARAPDGKEVEDLARKEIIKAMRSRIPLDQYHSNSKARQYSSQRDYRDQRDSREQRQQAQQQAQHGINNRGPGTGSYRPSAEPEQPSTSAEQPRGIGSDDDAIQAIEPEPIREEPSQATQRPAVESAVLSELSNGLDALSGTLRSRLYDNSGTVVKEVPIRDLLSSVQGSSNVYGIVLDGVITQRLVDLALQKGIRAIYGLRSNPMSRKHENIILYTKEQGSMQ